MPKATDISRLPLQRLFNQLAAADFELTAHEWYRAELALAQHQHLLYSSEGLTELELILGPLLCKNEKEQQRFKVIYQEFLSKLSAGVSHEAETQQTEPVLKSASWWIPLVILIGLLGLLSFGMHWYQNNYGAARNAARFQYEVIGDLDNFKLGDTLQLINQTTAKDTSKYAFFCDIQDASQQVRWSYEGFQYRNLIFDNPNEIQHSLHFIVRDRKDGTQVYSGPVQPFRVNCAQAPIVKDIIEVSGERKVGETLTFSIETEGTGFTYHWNLGVDSLLTSSNPSWTFTEAGDYPIQLSLVDTTGQLGYCTTKIGTNLQIEDDQPQPVLVDLPQLILQKDQENLNFSFQSWLYFLLGLLVALAGLFWWLWDRQRKKYEAAHLALRAGQMQELQVQDKAPYQIPFRQHSEEIQKGSLPFQMGNVLRRRQEGSRQILDIPNTIKQTVEGGGFLDLQYRLNTRPTDYLFLIDQSSAKSHLARLFLYLTQTLRDQDVHVDYWTYQGDFDRFWNPQHQGYVDLNQLQKAFGDRKLIVFGNGEALLEHIAARDHLETLANWKYRILVTPKPLTSWSSKEKQLYQTFPVFPADLENLMDAAQLIEREWEADDLPAYFADWKRRIALKQPEDPDSEVRLSRWSHYHTYLEQHPQLLPWIKSLVVHPELRWDLTIALGKAAGAPVTFDNLLILSRIPAFEEGAFPLKVWRSIWDQLDLEQEWQARQALKTELEAIPEETIQGSFAQNQIETDLDIHNFALDPYNKKYQDAIRIRMATRQIDALRQEELDLVIHRQTDTRTEDKSNGAATETFLKEQEEAIKTPWLTPYFWIAGLFTLLPILFGVGSLLVSPQTIGQYFYDKKEEVPFYLRIDMNEAQRLNNLAVDNLYTNPEAQPFVEIARQSSNYLQQAVNLDTAYQIAQDNYVKLAYLLGRDGYQEEREASQTFGYFDAVINSPFEDGDESDSLRFYALFGLASLQYTELRPDSACFYVEQMREDYLEQLVRFGKDMPFLSTCGTESTDTDTTGVLPEQNYLPEISPFKVYALPSTPYAPTDNSFSQNLIVSLSNVGQNTSLQDWSIGFNNRYNNTLIFDGGRGADEDQLVFNQRPAVGNNSAVLFYANNFDAYPNLSAPQSNAQGMDKALTSLGFRTEVRAINSARDFNQMIDNLRTRSYGPQDQLIIYISSYFYLNDGLSEGNVPDQLIPANGSLNDPGSCINLRELQEKFNQIPCNRILFIIDPFEIEKPDIQSEEPPIIEVNDLIKNFADYSLMIGPRRYATSTGFSIDEIEGKLIVAAPYTRPDPRDLRQYGPGHKILFGASNEQYDATLITDYPNEGIAFFSIPNTNQYQWKSDFYTNNIQLGQKIGVSDYRSQVRTILTEGTITALEDESFRITLDQNLNQSRNIVFAQNRIAGLTTSDNRGSGRENIYQGIPFDYILALWENTMTTHLDQIVPPEDTQRDNTSNTYAIVVGLDGDDSNYFQNSAINYSNFLRTPEGGALNQDEVTVFLQTSARSNDIIAALNRTLRQADANDMVFIYFATRLTATGLMTTDGQIPFSRLNDILQTNQAKFVFNILDGCYTSDPVDAPDQPGKIRQLQDDYYSNFSNQTNVTSILLANPQQECVDPASRSTILNNYLIRGLKGEADTNKNNMITAQELFSFMNQSINSNSKGQQSLIVRGNYDPQLPFSVLPVGRN